MWKYYSKAILACLLWSTAFAGVKLGLTYADPLFFAGIRFMLAGLLVLLLTKERKNLLGFLKASWRTALLVGLLQTGIMYGLYFNGVNLLPAAIAAIINGAGPLVTAITTHFCISNDRLNRQKVISLSIALTGVILISIGRNSGTPTGNAELLGIGLLILSSVTNAFSQVIVKTRPNSPLLLNATQLFIGGFMLLAASLIFEGRPTFDLPLEFYGALLWLSIVSAAAFSIWYTMLQVPEIKVSEINIFKFIIPVAGAILSWIIFPADKADLISVTGMVIIAFSVLLYYRNRPERI